MTHSSGTITVDVQIDHGQLYMYAVAPWAADPSNDAVLRALDDAQQSGRMVGVADGLIDLVTPVQWNLQAPMRIELWPSEPQSDDENWDHVVDVDLDVPEGQLFFEASGGWAPIRCDVPSGTYRARVSGCGYNEGVDGVEGMDSYRLRLWPRSEARLPELRKSWSGWEKLN
jgi:hypothetical protein